MNYPAFLTDFTMNLTQNQLFYFGPLFVGIVAIVGSILFAMGAVMYFKVESSLSPKMKDSTKGMGVLTFMLGLGAFFVLIAEVNSERIVESYTTNTNYQYSFDGKTLYSKVNYEVLKGQSNIQIKYEKDFKVIGQIKCGDLTLKACFHQVAQAQPVASDSSLVIDVANLQLQNGVIFE